MSQSLLTRTRTNLPVVALWSGSLMGAGLTLGAIVVASRILGAEIFGVYNVGYSLASLLALPVGYGLGSTTTYYHALGRKMDGRGYGVPFDGLALFALAVVLAWVVTELFFETTVLLHVSLATGVLIVGYYLLEGMLKGSERFYGIAIARAVSGVVLVGVVALLALRDSSGLTGHELTIGRGIAFLLPTVAVAISTVDGPLKGIPRLEERFGRQPVWGRVTAGAAAVSLPTVLLYSDKVILSAFMPFEAIGLYSVYFIASYLVVGRLSEPVLLVLFPRGVAKGDRGSFSPRSQVLIYVVMVALATLSQVLVFLFVSAEYEANPALIVLFAVGAGFFGLEELLWWDYAGRHPGAMRAFAAQGLVGGAILASGLLTLPRLYGIPGAAVATSLGAGYLLFAANRIRSRGTG